MSEEHKETPLPSPEILSSAIVVREKEMENLNLKMELKLEKLKSSMELELLNQKLEYLTLLQETKIAHLKDKEKDRKEAHKREIELIKEKSHAHPYPHHLPPGIGRFIGSALLPANMEHFLIGWTGSSISNWNLVFRASLNGDAASTFHALSDNKACTLVLVKVGGYIFGGYNTACWNSATNSYLNAPGSFLFTLVNPYGDPPTLFSCKNLAHAVYCHTSYGPTFGSGHDLCIHNSARSNTSSYCNLGNGYNDTLGRGANTFTGGKNFTITDYEVFVRC